MDVALHLLPGGHRSVVGTVLDIHSVVGQTAGIPQLLVLLAVELGEAPLLRDEDLLATGELELRTTQSLDHGSLVPVAGAHRHDRLSDVHTGHGSQGFTEGTSHSGLESGWGERGIELIYCNLSKCIEILSGVSQECL